MTESIGQSPECFGDARGATSSSSPIDSSTTSRIILGRGQCALVRERIGLRPPATLADPLLYRLPMTHMYRESVQGE